MPITKKMVIHNFSKNKCARILNVRCDIIRNGSRLVVNKTIGKPIRTKTCTGEVITDTYVLIKRRYNLFLLANVPGTFLINQFSLSFYSCTRKRFFFFFLYCSRSVLLITQLFTVNVRFDLTKRTPPSHTVA